MRKYAKKLLSFLLAVVMIFSLDNWYLQPVHAEELENNKISVLYESGEGISLTVTGGIYSTQSLDEEDTITFVAGTSYIFTYTAPEGTGIWKLSKIAGEDAVDLTEQMSINGNSTQITVTPTDATPFQLCFFTSEAQYNYHTFEAGENARTLSYECTGGGTATIDALSMIEDTTVCTYKNYKRAAISNNAGTLVTFTISPDSQKEFRGITVDSGDPDCDGFHPASELVRVGALNAAQTDLTLEIPTTANLYIQFEFQSDAPGCTVHFDAGKFEVTELPLAQPISPDVKNIYSDDYEYTYRFASREGQEDNFYGIEVLYGNTRNRIRKNALNECYYNIQSDAQACNSEITVLDYDCVFDNEIRVSYDNETYGGIDYQVLRNGSEMTPGQIYNYASGVDIVLTFSQTPYLIFDENDTNHVAEMEGLTLTLPTDGLIRSYDYRVYWSQEDFNYSQLQEDPRTQFMIETRASENGMFSFAPVEGIYIDSYSYNGKTRIVYDNSVTDFNILCTPDEHCTFNELRINNVPVSNLTPDVNGVVSYLYHRAQSDGSYVSFEANFNGPSSNPVEPNSYRVRYDSSKIDVTSAIGSVTNSVQENRDIDYPEATAPITLTFTPEAGRENEFYGISVRQGENETYIRKLGLLRTDLYQYIIPVASQNADCEIEVIDRECAFDNEIMVHYDESYEHTEYSVYKGDTKLAGNEYFTYEENENVILIFSQQPYCIGLSLNGSSGMRNLTSSYNGSNNTVVIDTTEFSDMYRVDLYVYWSVNESNYKRCQENRDNHEFLVESHSNENGSLSIASSNEASPVSHTYRNSTRTIYHTNITSSLTITCTPNTDCSFRELRINGNKIPDSQYSVNPAGVMTCTYNTSALSDSRLNIEAFFDTQGQVPNDPQNPGGNESGATDYEGAAEAIGYKEYGFYADDSMGQLEYENLIKDYFVNQLWYNFFNPDTLRPYAGMFNSKLELKNNTILNFESQINTTLPEGMQNYATYQVSFDENGIIAANGAIYLFEDPDAIAVVVNETNDDADENSYHYLRTTDTEDRELTFQCPYATNSDGEPVRFIVFGNGAEIIGNRTAGSMEYNMAFHVTDEHAGGPDNNTNAHKINVSLIVYNTTFEGVKITGDSVNTASAWGFGRFPVYSTNETQDAIVYFGNEFINIAQPEDAGHAIVSVTCTLPAGQSEKAVSIQRNAVSGTFKVTFLSAFYDVIPLKIEYSNRKIDNIYIRRAGIDIQTVHTTPESSTQGTFNLGTGTSYNIPFASGCNTAVCAGYYYPAGTESNRVNLFATYIWADGHTSFETIAADNVAVLDSDQGTSKADVFVLWDGDGEEAPESIQVIAVLPSADNTVFGGAKFGSGAGVTWNNDIVGRD